jgi:hypothetical protein
MSDLLLSSQLLLRFLLLASLVINELLFGLKSNLKRRGIGGESKKSSAFSFAI